MEELQAIFQTRNPVVIFPASGTGAWEAAKAVMVVHNETSTGIASRIGEVRQVMDEAKHPALLMVDAISSLASMDYRHDEWGVVRFAG